MDLPHAFEVAVSLGIFLVATTLATISLLAWRRERTRRMAIVGAAYGTFALGGLLAATEPWLVQHLTYRSSELVETSGGVFFLIGLLLFFWALVK